MWIKLEERRKRTDSQSLRVNPAGMTINPSEIDRNIRKIRIKVFLGGEISSPKILVPSSPQDPLSFLKWVFQDVFLEPFNDLFFFFFFFLMLLKKEGK
jgi:hypothetical protein